MNASDRDLEQLLAELQKEVGRWEDSQYHVAEEDLFDLKRFLLDRGRQDLVSTLESLYGTPLNRAFWGRLLPYRRLRRVRLELAARQQEQREHQARFLRSYVEFQRELALFLDRLEREEETPRPALRIVSDDPSPEE
ncbi:hypothetical protein SAMN02746041_01956 [Desulfacinum hydrothermale DSM 13146]|uniref:Uncharacterized protein n=1 Tax=Desulfacinum hydrothermale DSM 13146 TaxID=1121390 RepID=A0A1W1XJK4_9BACT|nr:hypothetical protein [Desulfacinum hydrothermale]SMC24176.1 hypothetical protein SAMN02746041_01956 [Desulfacinum hydrothermale DSM 13146]